MQLICRKITKRNISAETQKLPWLHLKVEGFSVGRVRWDIGEEELEFQLGVLWGEMPSHPWVVCRGPECWEMITLRIFFGG